MIKEKIQLGAIISDYHLDTVDGISSACDWTEVMATLHWDALDLEDSRAVTILINCSKSSAMNNGRRGWKTTRKQKARHLSGIGLLNQSLLDMKN